MTQPVDADELLTRMRGARDWAAREAERKTALTETLRREDRRTEAGDADVEARVFRSICVVLDEILQPGSHSDRA
ncbi:hypothetical protein ABZS76_26775 [Streptomyces sp. NPDC005562]|uniref:hypothetical protein n=1 Tax=unclassified Streptomyces TaxID=2593676 RepID=UPI0033BA9EE0